MSISECTTSSQAHIGDIVGECLAHLGSAGSGSVASLAVAIGSSCSVSQAWLLTDIASLTSVQHATAFNVAVTPTRQFLQNHPDNK